MQHFLLNLNSACSNLSPRNHPTPDPSESEDSLWIFTSEPRSHGNPAPVFEAAEDTNVNSISWCRIALPLVGINVSG